MSARARILMPALLAIFTLLASAQEKPPPLEREIIPGSELMTSQERERYRKRMRGARTADEQSAVREDHLKQMRERARLRGLALPGPQQKSAP